MPAKPPPPGTVLAVPLKDGRHGVARVLRHPVVEFYETSMTDGDAVDLEKVTQSPVAFRIWVMDSATGGRRWKKIGEVPLSEEERTRRELFCTEDGLSKELSTYWTDPETGEVHEEPATRQEALALEPAAVWSAEHVQDRLLDHLEGRESTWVRAVRPKSLGPLT